MMEQSPRKSTRPMKLAELMPNLFGTLQKSNKLNARKGTEHDSSLMPRTTGKDFGTYTTYTMAQLCAALKPKSSPARGRAPPSSMKKKWNTSTKYENKKISHTANANSKQFKVRKILNFQAVPKPVMSNIPRPSMKPTFLTPNAVERETKVNKALKHLQGKNNVRISGICDIKETPAINHSATRKSIWNNKENMSGKANASCVSFVKPQSVLDESFRHLLGNKQIKSVVPGANLKTSGRQQETNTMIDGLSEAQKFPRIINTKGRQESKIIERANNKTLQGKAGTKTQTSEITFEQKVESVQIAKLSTLRLPCIQDESPTDPTDSQGNSEQSFLKHENDIYNETVREVHQDFKESPLVSTPFKQYRNVPDCLDQSSDFEESCNDTTVMNFDRVSFVNANNSGEESDIISLCDLMDKAKVTYDEKAIQNYETELIKIKTDLEDESERLKEQKRFVVMSMKRNEMMLASVNKLLQLNKTNGMVGAANSFRNSVPNSRFRVNVPEITTKRDNLTGSTSCKTFVRRVSNSPSYKIPKHSPCLRKKLLFKSVPMGLDKINPVTPKGRPTPGGTAMAVYLKMKEQCNFLMTPVMNKSMQARNAATTPAITSMNLQSQLEKLYNETP